MFEHVLSYQPEGVYVGVAQLDGESRGYVCIINQGRHPTVPEGIATVEAHLLGHAHRDLYGLELTLAYCLYLRPEQTFPSLEALREQLDRDRLSAVRWARDNAPYLLTGLDLFPHQA